MLPVNTVLQRRPLVLPPKPEIVRDVGLSNEERSRNRVKINTQRKKKGREARNETASVNSRPRPPALATPPEDSHSRHPPSAPAGRSVSVIGNTGFFPLKKAVKMLNVCSLRGVGMGVT